jgi:aminoglycoside phosphotransferase (APT) family kinase protein
MHIDPSRLNDWLLSQEIPGEGPVEEITPLPGGAQNVLHTLRRADGTELVLRRPGRHLAAAAASSFEREAKVLTALARTPVPHPRLYASSIDETVFGTPFAILQKIDGFTPRGQLPGAYGTDPAWRENLAFEFVAGAAELVSHYAGLTGSDVTNFPWYEVLAYFRLAALLEGTYVRALNGKLDSATGKGMHGYAAWLWAKAEQLIG